ncbi:hypothetical protein [Sphingopyxis sp. 2PD]|uniref:hypothetical protein n=1 Tax=Sphingopyxis sp. 2PD TaxID=2502196 RepID=UPI001485778E|nr:hypothetical protein [Sphingopyxis sp. 2PD]
MRRSPAAGTGRGWYSDDGDHRCGAAPCRAAFDKLRAGADQRAGDECMIAA